MRSKVEFSSYYKDETNPNLGTSINYVVALNDDSSSQREVFSKIANCAQRFGYINKPKILIKDFFHREKETSTGFGEGFAIPHARNKDIEKPAVFFIRSKKDINWDAIDDQPVTVVIALLVPEGQANDIHLEMLANIARRLMKPEIKAKLKSIIEPEEIIKELTN